MKKKKILKRIFAIENNSQKINLYMLLRYTLLLSVLFTFVFFVVFLWLLKPKSTHRLVNLADRDVLTALKWLEERDLKAVVFRKFDDKVEPFHVISQRPEAGIEVKEGRKVTLVVSDGAGEDQMPSLVGQPFRQARRNLFALFSGNITLPEILKVEEYSSDFSPGLVTRHTPNSGDKVDFNKEITLFVSKGEKGGNFKMEDFSFKNYDEVYRYLANKNISVRVNYLPTENKEDIGKIFSQNIEVGEVVSRGQTIYFEVAVARNEGEEGLANEEVEILRVVDFRMPPGSGQNDFLEVSAIISDSRGEITVPVRTYPAARTISLPYKTLGEGVLKVYVKGELYKEFYF